MRRALKTLLILAAGLAVIAGAVLWWGRGARDPRAVFRTAPVTHRSLVAAINATGTVEPEEVVDVGAQVAGLIRVFVLARIDNTLYAADVETAKAQLQQAQANHRSAITNVAQMRAKPRQAA
jgi:HlyD family secretion protein